LREAERRTGSKLEAAIGPFTEATIGRRVNDLGQASRSYENGACGGAHNEQCLHATVEEVEENWDAITGEILSLRSTDETIIRTAGLGYTPRVDRVFEPYLDEVNRHIAASAADNSIPYAEIHLGGEDMSSDGVHPNDRGYGVIAARLRELGYEPLGLS
jgi:lysophospholipase L1-like esterase